MKRSLPLRAWFFIGFAFVSWIPIAVFAGWIYFEASDRMEEDARVQHQTLSGHLTLALERYARNAESAAEFIVANRTGLVGDAWQILNFVPLFDDHGIRTVTILDRDENHALTVFCPVECEQGGRLDDGFYQSLVPYLAAATAQSPSWIWSGVLEGAGASPMLYLVKDIGPDGFAVAELTTRYIVELQSQIAFGEKGHAAIVDGNGRVIAHPLEAWMLERKDISRLSVVQAMMRGETGVMTFYSPAMRAGMVAGFSTVAAPGWGVMVPQPRSEIAAPAKSLLSAIMVLALAVGIFTTVAAWFIASLITRGVRPIEEIAARIADGDFHGPMERSRLLLPTELERVANSIDTMAEQIGEAVRARIDSQSRAYRIEQMDRAKSVVLANVSHEFRTPLNAIIGFSSTMADEMFGPLGAKRYQEYSALIRESGQHLLSLVDDILQVAADDVKDRDLKTELIDLEAVVRDVSGMVSMAYGSRCQHMITVEGETPLVKGERRQIKQLLINLLDNAEKYSPEGSKVQIRISSDRDLGTVLKVIDSGFGMTEQEIAECLQPFGRGLDPHVRHQKGTGLGLAVVLSIVERHGARMNIESKKGDGTEVTVIFEPLMQEDEEAA